MAPVTEELILRGAAFTRLARTGLEASGAIAVTAAIFAILHLQVRAWGRTMILIDGCSTDWPGRRPAACWCRWSAT